MTPMTCLLKKSLVALIALWGLSTQAFAASPPPIDFTGLDWPSFNNSPGIDNTSFAGIGISGFTYNSSLNTYDQTTGYLWLRSNTNDHGLGYCSSGETCGATDNTGGGDYNELSNNNKKEIIRLTLPDGKQWSDIWVSSLDDGGSNDNETGTVYWSNSEKPNLSSGAIGFATFSHDGLFHSSADVVEGSIFAHLVANVLDVNAKYLFFRAGKYNAAGSSLNSSNNDYLVWGVGVTAVPEPEIYAMMAAGFGLMGWVARRRNRQTAAV